MSSVAILEELDGRTADWKEKVSNDQYHKERQDNDKGYRYEIA